MEVLKWIHLKFDVPRNVSFSPFFLPPKTRLLTFYIVVELLKALFIKLQETQERAISPEYDLAYMALLNEKDDDDTATETLVEETPVNTLINTNTKDNTNDLIDLKTDIMDLIDLKEDTDMVDAAADKTLPDDTTPPVELPSTISEADVETAFRRTSFSNEIPPPDYSPPSYNDIVPDNMDIPPIDEKVAIAVAEPEVLKGKERPSVDTMMFGKQQDVTGIVNLSLLETYLY